MSKKRKQNGNGSEVINIDSLNLHIDYDKLAEAIVKSNNKAAEPPKQDKTEEKVSFVKLIPMILFNKRDTGDRLTTGTFALIIEFVFRVVSVVLFLVSGIGLCELVRFFIESLRQGLTVTNVIAIILVFELIIVSAIIALLVWGAANEIEKETDKSFIVSVFSGIVALAALIVAVVDFFRG